MKSIILALCVVVASSVQAQIGPQYRGEISVQSNGGDRSLPHGGGKIVGNVVTPAPGVGSGYGTTFFCFGPSGVSTPVTATYTLRSLSSSYPLPMRVEGVIGGPLIERSKFYADGNVVVVWSGTSWPLETVAYVYRAVGGGTTSSTDPSFKTTLNSTTQDGGVAWVNLGSVFTATEITLPVGAQANQYAVTMNLPTRSNTISVSFGIRWGNSTTPVPAQVVPVEVSDVSIPATSYCYP